MDSGVRSSGDDVTGYFAGFPDSLAVWQAIWCAVADLPGVEARASKSQVALRAAGHAFACVWRPGQYVRSSVPVVLSIGMPAPLTSARFKQVVHPSRKAWVHHLELGDPAAVDGEVRAWLRQAHQAAYRPRDTAGT